MYGSTIKRIILLKYTLLYLKDTSLISEYALNNKFKDISPLEIKKYYIFTTAEISFALSL